MRPSPSMPAGNAGSGHALADRDPAALASDPPRRAQWGDLRLRVLSAAVLAPVALAGIWYGGPSWNALIAIAGVGLALEWVALCRAPPGVWPGFGVLAAVLAGIVLTAAGQAQPGVAALLAGAGLVLVPHWRLAAGVPYAGLGAVALVWLRADPVAGRGNVIFLVLAVWASDIGAYAAGRLLGGPKLAPLISPGKTWSGAAGGLVAAMLVGLVAGEVIAPGAAIRAAMLAALIGAASQGGDLLESAIKRGFGVKDSGRLIPGHGGLMDRLDGLLAAAPVAAGLALLIGRGTTLWH
jgi:phosphatidate cytidylyltransferase